MRVDPLPEVRTAFQHLSDLFEEPADLPGRLDAVGRVAAALVPSCVGVSLSIFVDGDTFTLTSTAPEAELVDAGQYLDSAGPCLEAIETGRQVRVDDVLDEGRWQMYRQSSADAGVRSSLSLPLRDDEGRITGALNMYAREPSAFQGLEEIFAAVFGAKVSEAVWNADLTFQTRQWARELPDRLQARETVDIAVGALAQLRGWSPEAARSKLATAAQRAGVDVVKVADIVVNLTA